MKQIKLILVASLVALFFNECSNQSEPVNNQVSTRVVVDKYGTRIITPDSNRFEIEKLLAKYIIISGKEGHTTPRDMLSYIETDREVDNRMAVAQGLYISETCFKGTIYHCSSKSNKYSLAAFNLVKLLNMNSDENILQIAGNKVLAERTRHIMTNLRYDVDYLRGLKVLKDLGEKKFAKGKVRYCDYKELFKEVDKYSRFTSSGISVISHFTGVDFKALDINDLNKAIKKMDDKVKCQQDVLKKINVETNFLLANGTTKDFEIIKERILDTDIN